jgi:hypothetical protein
LPHAIEEPPPEDMRVEVDVFKTNPVIIRVAKQFDLFMLPVKDCKPNDRKSSESSVVSVVEEYIINCGA